ncbi:aryl hydrocarbon receptor nuclear translocator homolog [Anopheles bellator]|uniref:aryl hydrocarbon receptor nuclear translocator homolog n=1 Tax=Anopheles bellator TaxID=139047 RepID=UPI0026483F47|nr:aryl hydrocarbon receptor nuclear translocator homolog [Anopheles bellator]
MNEPRAGGEPGRGTPGSGMLIDAGDGRAADRRASSVGSYDSDGDETPGPSTASGTTKDSTDNGSSRNGREARNRAEKNRRDKLNGSIQELSAMVPHVAESPRRVDKTAVLRFSAHGLRIDYVFGKSKPEPTVKPEAQDSLFRMLNGFLLTVTCRGQIVLVSASVEQFLGHCQTDLYGQNLFSITHPDDHGLLKQQLVPSNLVYDVAPGTSSSVGLLNPVEAGSGCGGSAPDTESRSARSHDNDDDDIDRRLQQDKRRFSIRMARAGPRSEATTYELVTIDGCFRRADSAPRDTSGGKHGGGGASAMQMIRRARSRDDAMPLHSINGNDIVLIGIARVMKVPSICDRLIEACKYEYKTRHLIDGRIVQCDQRISIVAGYLTDEVSGVSPFTFMHRDDVRWVIVALRQMYDYNQNGESCYRLMSRTGDFIYLKTRGYLEVDSDTKVVQSFVCINTLVSDEEGQRMVREMKRKFSVIVAGADELPDESGEPAVENAKQIEEAVFNLITDLQPDSEDKLLMTMPASPANSCKSGVFGDGTSGQLAIVAPEKSSVKSAIVRSINVVSIAAKTMRESHRSSATAGHEWSPMSGDQQCSNGSSSSSSSGGGTSTSMGSPMPHRTVISPSPPVLSPNGAPGQRATVLQKGDRPQQMGSPGPEQRVPPLPTSEHYFTQPFSPSAGAAGGAAVPLPVLSPASSLHSQRSNAHSPFSSVPSPPTFSSGSVRTTSVLKRTYSNSSINSLHSSENFGELGEVGGGDNSKRSKPNAGSSELGACYNDLINPATDLSSLLPNSFDALDQSLLTMESTTAIIREQVGNYSTLHESHDQRLERIVEEQQEQREMLQSIQQEYHFQIQTNGTVGGARATSDAGTTPQRTTAGPTSMMPSVITSSAVRPTYNGSGPAGPNLEPGS